MALHGVVENTLYSHGGLGRGDILGIECVDGAWCSYFSERGSKGDYKALPSEADAVEEVRAFAEGLARRKGRLTEQT